MKILHCTFALSCGGVETLLVSLANRQARMHSVEVCTITPPSTYDIARRGLDESVSQTHLGKRGVLSGFRAMAVLARKLRSERYDIVHIHGQLYYYVAAIVSAPASTRFVYTVHNDASHEDGRWDRLLTPLKRKWFYNGRLTAVTISVASKHSFETYYGSDVYSVLIPNGIEPVEVSGNSGDALAAWRINPSTRVFVNPGRLYVQKNQVELCKAFHLLLGGQNAPDVQLIIAGPPEEPDILERIKPYLCERIVYAGACDNLPQMLASADAMILPSLWEGMPISLLECLSVGCVPVCTLVGGVADIVGNDSGCGIVINTPLAVDIAEAVKSFAMMDDMQVEKLKARSREAFASYDIRACAEKYIDLYENLVAER